MNDNTKYSMQKRAFRNAILQWMVQGLCGLKKKRNIIILTIMLLVLTMLYVVSFEKLPHISSIQLLFNISFAFIAIFSLLAVLILIGVPKESFTAGSKLDRIGLVNKAHVHPYLLQVSRDSQNQKKQNYKFSNEGIPPDEWEDKKLALGASFDKEIIDINYFNGKKYIIVTMVDAIDSLSNTIDWDDSYISSKDSELVLGESAVEPVKVDLNKQPMLLIAGGTGSGKTILLKLLLYQCMLKHFIVIISDFKGGVDYDASWRNKVDFITNIDTLIKQLQKLVDTLNQRKVLFVEKQVPNIETYNSKVMDEQKLQRIIFACDEIAELLDKTGADSEQKEQISKVINLLSTIARQGRAFGIHLILSTQRPDANILPGQIKNNIDFRCCGKADNVLSQIILDNTSASDEIPKNSQGRFITNDGTVFQAYYFKEVNHYD